MSATAHKVKYPFDEQKPSTLAICCSDGRYIRAIEQFLFTQGVDSHDLLCLPGGPARICHECASIFEVSVAMEGIDYLVEAHQTRTVLLVAHADCGFYKKRFGECVEDRQKTDLKRARERILERHSGLKVAGYLAGPASAKKEDGFTMQEIAV